MWGETDMKKLSALFCLLGTLIGQCVGAETLTLWNAHSLEHLQPELEAFQRLTGHKVQQQHFRADQIRDQVLTTAVLPDLYFIPSDQISNVQEYHLLAWPEAGVDIAAMARHFPGNVFLGAAPRYDGSDQAWFDSCARMAYLARLGMVCRSIWAIIW